MTEQTRTARDPGGRLAALDGLRLIAALMVLLFHFAGKTVSVEQIWSATPQQAFPTLHHAAHYSWLGVELFRHDGRTIRLTDVGARYLRSVTEHLTGIAEATGRATGRAQRGPAAPAGLA